MSKQAIIDLHPKRVVDYGCVRCQQYHEEGDPLYEEHKFFQSKHGIREWVDDSRWEPKGVNPLPRVLRRSYGNHDL